MIVIISASLNADSNSRILAQEAGRVLEQEGQEVSLMDFRDLPLPLCDGGAAYGHPNVARIGGQLRMADAILIATPIYNYHGTAAVKNLIELTGRAWENKVVGFLCAAGGMGSYMSSMPLANSLMLDFRTLVVPRFVYATGDAFVDGRIDNADIAKRMADLATAAVRLGRAVKAA
jgi:NAD(P)H-dependent FMN reductase